MKRVPNENQRSEDERTPERLFVIRALSLIRASSFLPTGLELAAAGPVAVERARDIDRSLLLSASRQE